MTNIVPNAVATKSKNENIRISKLYNFILDDKKYFTVFRLLERANNLICEREAMSRAVYESLDGILLQVETGTLSITDYDSLVLKYTNMESFSLQDFQPSVIEISNIVQKDYYVPNKRITFTPFNDVGITKEKEYELNDLYFEFPNEYTFPDYSAELFQYSLLLDTITEEEIHEIICRVYNLPVLQGYRISLYDMLASLSDYKELDLLLRGYY